MTNQVSCKSDAYEQASLGGVGGNDAYKQSKPQVIATFVHPIPY